MTKLMKRTPVDTAYPREAHTTKAGFTVTLTFFGHKTQVACTNFVGSYQDETYARFVANVLYMEAATGCYACGVDAAGRLYLDRMEHTCGRTLAS